MRIGIKGDYGLRALIDLAEHFESGKRIQAKDIAARQAVPKDFLALIMIDLRKAGLVESTRGPAGGYRLARQPGEITMGEALAALEEPVAVVECTTELGYNQCSISLRCRMRNVWIEVNRAVSAILDRTTIADLCSAPPPAGETGDDAKSSVMPEGLTFQI